MSVVSVDPVTRIEGHLRVELDLIDNAVRTAWSSGTLFRGFERILTGRRPEDAWLLAQRVCGVCTLVHGLCSVRAVENATGATIGANARLIRNLLLGTQYLHDHLVHFYHLSLLDWVDVVAALSAEPTETAELARIVSPNAPELDYAAIQLRLRNLAESGKLGIFAGGYTGHPSLCLEPNECLLLIAHYVEALTKQNLAGRMHAIWGAKNPHLQSLRVGGVTCQAEITDARIQEFGALLQELRAFIDCVYVPDVVFLCQRYKGWFSVGGSEHFLAVGEFPESDSEQDSKFLPGGVVLRRRYDSVEPVDTGNITEHVAHSWYEASVPLSPAVGKTDPEYTDYALAERYTWLKAPRYSDKPMEVGPLARMLVARATGHREVQAAGDEFLSRLGGDWPMLNSTLGRIAARALETQVIAQRMHSAWLAELTTSGAAYSEVSTAVTARGVALNEAPRGALGHWVDIVDGTLANYQMVVPSTWNFGPRCSGDIPGPVESALVGTPVADSGRPLEALRTIHSFDPCLACAVHAVDARQLRPLDRGSR